MLLEDLAAVGMADIAPDIHLESPPLLAMGPVPEAPVADAWIPEAEPQELSYVAARESQPFLDHGKARVSFPFLDFCIERSGALQGWGWLETLTSG